MNELSNAFLKSYLNNASPTGYEMSGQRLWVNYIKPYVDTYSVIDPYGSVAAMINPEASYKLILDAHADEISWTVNYIHSNGYISVISTGACDQQLAPSKRVNIHTQSGTIKGVFGWPATHLQKKESPSIKTDDLFIDCGCHSKEEVEAQGIQVGDPITYDEGVLILNNRYLCARGLDNRISGFILAEVARLLKKNKIKKSFGIYFVNSVQEEVGRRIAEAVSHRLNPDIALVTEVYHDTQLPVAISKRHGDITCGKGPVIHLGPAMQTNLRKMLIDTAQKNEVPYQLRTAVRSGTNAETYAYSGKGVPSALISIPLKYMHTSVEMVHLNDLNQTIRLIYAFVAALENQQCFRFSL